MMKPPHQGARPPWFCDSYGIVLRRDALTKGVDDDALRRLVQSKVLIRLRQGLYCYRPTFMEATHADRCRILCRAVIQLYEEHVVLSHCSSCLMHDGPDFGLDLDVAHLTHLTGGGRRKSRIVHHMGACEEGDIHVRDGIPMTVEARAVVEVTCRHGVEAGLVQANHFLHTGAITREQLEEQADRAALWQGSLALHVVLLLADARIESVGESRSDLCFFRGGLPRPELQYEVEYPDGRVAARVDFAWPQHKLIVEFDGRAKYHRYRKAGESIADMVEREKKREDLIRELTGWTVVRITWADLDHPEHTVRRIRRAMRSVAA